MYIGTMKHVKNHPNWQSNKSIDDKRKEYTQINQKLKMLEASLQRKDEEIGKKDQKCKGQTPGWRIIPGWRITVSCNQHLG